MAGTGDARRAARHRAGALGDLLDHHRDEVLRDELRDHRLCRAHRHDARVSGAPATPPDEACVVAGLGRERPSPPIERGRAARRARDPGRCARDRSLAGAADRDGERELGADVREPRRVLEIPPRAAVCAVVVVAGVERDRVQALAAGVGEHQVVLVVADVRRVALARVGRAARRDGAEVVALVRDDARRDHAGADVRVARLRVDRRVRKAAALVRGHGALAAEAGLVDDAVVVEEVLSWTSGKPLAELADQPTGARADGRVVARPGWLSCTRVRSS